LALVATAAAATGGWAATPPQPKRGVVRLIARVPSPGYPAFPLVVGQSIYEGTYANPNGDSIPSHVFKFSGAGRLLRTYVVKGQNLKQDHGIQVATTDAHGHLVLLDDTSGRILLLNPKTGRQTLYSRVANLPTCSADHDKPPCSPARLDLPPEPDYAAWGRDGSLYVTDYQQAVIWRVPPHGGKATVWLADSRLDGALFGTAGLVMLADHHTLLFDQASNAGLGSGSGNPSTGKLYSVAIEAGHRHGPLHQLWESPPAAAPDGFALSRSGHIYVALVGPTANDIVELSATGRQLATFGTPILGANGSSVPFDEPSGVSFLDTELVIANQSYLEGDTSHMALLGLGTGEPGAQTYVPRAAGPKPTRRRRHHRRHHR
jgi:hypothetical protein